MSRFGKRGPRGSKAVAGNPEKPAPAPAKRAAPERPRTQKATTLPAPRPRPSPAAAPTATAAALPAWILAPPEPEPMPPPRDIPRGAGFAIGGDHYEKHRLEVIRRKGFPRAFYAFSLAAGIAPLDPTEEEEAIIGTHAASLRHRVTVLWAKCGGVVIQHEGRRKLAVVIEPEEARPSIKSRKAKRGQ